MKKLLAGTTALVAACVVAGQSQAAEPISISIGGFMNQYVGFVDNDGNYNDVNGNIVTNADYAEVYTAQESELYFSGSTTLDNGLTVAVRLDQRTDRNDDGEDQLDDVFMTISSETLGAVEIGMTKTKSYDMAITAPVGGIGLNDSDFGAFTNHLGQDGLDRLGTMGADAGKINYISPNFMGLQVAATYGLEATDDFPGSLDLRQKATDTGAGAAAAYSGEFSGVGVGLSATYYKVFSGGTSGQPSQKDISDETTYTLGAEVSFAGFTVGGGYTEVESFNQQFGRDYESFDVGVAYSTGPYTISAGYANFEDTNNPTITTDTDETDLFVAAVEYDLGAGITADLSIYDAENDNDGNANDTREGFGVMAGIKASF